jgi:hypothetical protein
MRVDDRGSVAYAAAPFRPRPCLKTFDDSRTSVAYAGASVRSAWAVQWGHDAHKATAFTLGLRDAR